MSQQKDGLAKRIGSNFRMLRLAAGVSTKNLAEETNLSLAFFSRMEKGKIIPSVATLQVIADVLKFDIELLFRRNEQKGFVIERAEKRRFVRRKGMTYVSALLAEKMENPFMEPFIVSLPRERQETEVAVHEGQEFLYVLEGAVEQTLGNQKFLLKKGDAAYWNGSLSHKAVNAGREPAMTLNVHMIPGKRRRAVSEEADAREAPSGTSGADAATAAGKGDRCGAGGKKE